MTSASVWLRPCKSSPVCRYSYNQTLTEDGKPAPLTVGRKMFSDCRVWLTTYERGSAYTEAPVVR